MKRKGISLIVLVITIVVIIILAAAVILSLGNNNPINNAKKAKVEQTMDTFKSDLSIQVANKLLNDSTLTVKDIDSRDEDEWRVTDLVPSIKGTEYENQLIVVDGKLKLKDASTLPETTQDIIKDSLGEAVAGSGGNEEPTDGKYKITYNLNGGTATNVTEYTEETDTITLTNPTKTGYGFTGWTGSNGSTPQKTVKIEKGSTGNKTYTANWLAIEGTDITKEMITSNASTYIGKTVTYTGYSENTNTIDWRLFGIDKDGNIMLKANDYIDLTYKHTAPLAYPAGISKGDNNYRIRSTNNRDTLIDYIGTSNNWNEFAISGKTTARGAMTLPEFVYGYNLVNTEKLDAKYLTAGQAFPDNSSKTASADGYVIKKGTGSYSTYIEGITEMYSGMKFYIGKFSKAAGMWLSSTSTYSIEEMILVDGSYRVDSKRFATTDISLCPVVSITSGVLVEKADGTLVVE